ncbi:hypothetical protein, partial [Flavobacterium sp.]|uniref:hypothetical protein n=1 Tax=Flavobacterium sp. TaxID=239 RepID=UPI002623ED6E
MKKLYILFLALTSVIGFSQGGGLNDDTAKLPNFTPPSPEAYALTKYGDVPVNEFRGMINQTIPLYTFKSGLLELPISVNYSGAGVKVDDLPTWAGINWTLEAGGVITRTVKDIPDEAATTRIILTDSDIQNYSTANHDGTEKATYLRDLVENGQKDSEVDIFNFSFSGYSGSFYLDGNLEAVILRNDQNLKIITGSNFLYSKTFQIITPAGVSYYFGGSGATEDTTLRFVTDGSVSPNDTNQGTTAFYLTRIQHPTQGSIEFEYGVLPYSVIHLSKDQSYPKLMSVIGFCNPGFVPGGVTTTSISSRVLEPLQLTKIKSILSNVTVEFVATNTGEGDFQRMLSKILIKSTSNSIVTTLKTIDFEYLSCLSSSNELKRFFLTKIIFDKYTSYSGRKNEVYEFEYNDPCALPKRLSFSQDYIGYYNGINNVNSLPNNWTFDQTNSIVYANREPNFTFASKGVLTKIHYPTGGYTVFDYEPKKVLAEDMSGVANVYAYRNQAELTPHNKLHDTSLTLIDDGITTLSNMYRNQDINIVVSLHANSTGLIQPQQEKVFLTIVDLTPNLTPTPTPETITIAMAPPQGNTPQERTLTKIIKRTLLEGHSYKIDLDIYPAEDDDDDEYTTSEPLIAKAYFNYSKGLIQKDYTGVRIKRQTDYADANTPSNIKRYYYSTVSEANSSGIPAAATANTGMPVKITYSVVNGICPPNPITGAPSFAEWAVHFQTLHSSGLENYFSNNGNGLFKNVSTSYGGDHFENGGVQKTYSIKEALGTIQIETKRYPNQIPQALAPLLDEMVSTSNLSIPSVLDGNIEEEIYFEKKDSQIKKISQKTYQYDYTFLKYINNVLGEKKYNALLFMTPTNISNTASNYYIQQYRTYSYKNEVQTVTTKEYFDSVPLGTTDESSFKKSITTQNYEYGTLRGLPTKVTTVVEGSGKTQETRNYYVNQASSLSGPTLNSTQLADFVNMSERNIVSTPIQVENYQNTEKLSTQRTLYRNWST